MLAQRAFFNQINPKKKLIKTTDNDDAWLSRCFLFFAADLLQCSQVSFDIAPICHVYINTEVTIVIDALLQFLQQCTVSNFVLS